MGLLEIGANDAAVSRRRGEYVVLQILDAHTDIGCDDIDPLVETIHHRLLESSEDSPFYFETGGSNGPESSELNESIERLLRYGKIRPTDDQCYELTPAGRDYLEDSQQLKRDRITNDFREAVADILHTIDRR